MKPRSFLVLCLPVLFLLPGCILGNPRMVDTSVEDIRTRITKGKSTDKDIVGLFGDPSRKGIHESHVYWDYYAQDVSPWIFMPLAWPFMQTIVNYELSIKFADDNTVADFYYRNNKRN